MGAVHTPVALRHAVAGHSQDSPFPSQSTSPASQTQSPATPHVICAPHRVPGGAVVDSHAWVPGPVAVQTFGLQRFPDGMHGLGPPWHTPPRQASPVEHASPSSHDTPSVVDVVRMHVPVSPSHVSAVHGLPSSHDRGPSDTHAPERHVPPTEHRSGSTHALPSASGTFRQSSVPQESIVQGFPSSQPAGTHAPPQHICPDVQSGVRMHVAPTQPAS